MSMNTKHHGSGINSASLADCQQLNINYNHFVLKGLEIVYCPTVRFV